MLFVDAVTFDREFKPTFSIHKLRTLRWHLLQAIHDEQPAPKGVPDAQLERALQSLIKARLVQDASDDGYVCTDRGVALIERSRK